MEWINLEQQLPPMNEPVLVCDELNEFVSMGKMIENIEVTGDVIFEMMYIEHVDADSIITHWMPLPKSVGVCHEL